MWATCPAGHGAPLFIQVVHLSGGQVGGDDQGVEDAVRVPAAVAAACSDLVLMTWELRMRSGCLQQ